MDDDAFNQLAYEDDLNPADVYDDFDEEAEYYLAQQNHPTTTTSEATGGTREPDPFDDDLDLDDIDPFNVANQENQTTGSTENEIRERRRLERERLPLGAHPLDWFLRAEIDGISAKRKKLELSDAISAQLADRIARERRKRQDAGKPPSERRNHDSCFYLQYPPEEPGAEYIRISDPDGLESGFLKLSLDGRLLDREYEKRRIQKAIEKSMMELARQSTTTPANDASNSVPTQNQSTAPNTSMNSTMDSTVRHRKIIEGVDLSQFGLNEQDFNDDVDDDFDFDAPPEPEPEDASTEETAAEAPISNKLWTAKYEPTTFLDLLTEDAQNKVVLAWLKLWDPYVFNRRANISGLVNEYYSQALEVQDKKPYLPKLKALIIHGSSGCGKTTLAQICAQQAGYSPFLLNLNEITSVAQLKSMVSEQSDNNPIDNFVRVGHRQPKDKPLCFVVEGLDAATADMVKFMVQYVSNGEKKVSDVRRPLLFLCNNPFAPVLKNLRVASVMVKVSSLNKDRTIKRLERICQLEGLKIKRFALVELFEQCRCDLRLCLNNLQFYSCISKGSTDNLNDQTSTRIEDFSIFDALDSVLTTNYHMDARGHIKAPRIRSETIRQVMSRRDDTERVYHALFYNAPLVFKLKAFQRLKICTALIAQDMFSHYSQQVQNYSMLRYCIAAALKIHFAIAAPVAHREKYNLNFMGFAERRKENLEVVQSVELAQRAEFRQPRSNLLLDILPALCSVISSPMEKGNAQVIGKAEKERLERIAETMFMYGLGFAQKVDAGTTLMALDPPIDNLVTFLYHGKHQQIPMGENAKKIIGQELAIKRIRGKALQANNASGPVAQLSNLMDPNKVRDRNAGSKNDPITDADFVYSAGSSQAIRRKIRNKVFFPFST